MPLGYLLNCDFLRLNTDVLPKNIDVFGSEIIIGWGFGDEPVIISKKFYNLLFKELKEKSKHFIIYPQMVWDESRRAVPTGKRVEDDFSYSSDNNTEWLTVEEIKELLKTVDLEK